jgi:hypothetical protein
MDETAKTELTNLKATAFDAIRELERRQNAVNQQREIVQQIAARVAEVEEKAEEKTEEKAEEKTET